MFKSPTEMEITPKSSFTRFAHSAAASRLCPLMSLLLDSSQCRRLVSSHPLWIVCTSTTHHSSLFLPALRVSRVAHYSDTPNALCDSVSGREHYCEIEGKYEGRAHHRSNPTPQTSHFRYSYMHTHTHTRFKYNDSNCG